MENLALVGTADVGDVGGFVPEVMDNLATAALLEVSSTTFS